MIPDKAKKKTTYYQCKKAVSRSTDSIKVAESHQLSAKAGLINYGTKYKKTSLLKLNFTF